MQLALIQFIQKHNNWEEILTEKPYYLKINRDNGFILFKYDQIKSDFSLDIVKESRGIILNEDTLEVVCYPFIKFFNIDEPYADKIDWNTSQVQEKIDGSLIKLWYKNGWKVSTNNTINAFKCELSNNTGEHKTFGGLFKSLLGEDILYDLNLNYTYMFELVSPYNKVVISYPEPDIYHIATRDNITGKEINCNIGIKKPKIYSLKTEKEIRNAAENLPFNEEGYVVVDKDYNRVKVKSPAYVNAHRLVNNHMVNNEKVLDLIRRNEQDEFLSYFPEYKKDFERINKLYNIFKTYMYRAEIRIKRRIKNEPDKKLFALWLKNKLPDYMTMGFMLRDNKISKYEEYLDGLTSSKIIERMKKYET